MKTQNRIKLINCDVSILESIIDGDHVLAEKLNVIVPDNWSENGYQFFGFCLGVLREDPSLAQWMIYLPVHKETNTLLGSCGYKGGPDENGMVEIGYEVATRYRNKGYATEITQLLVDLAFKNDAVTKVDALCAIDNNASKRVFDKTGFKYIKEVEDEEYGVQSLWRILKK